MLQPKFNKYPKPTDWNSLYFLAQQAFEDGFRGTTFKELVNYIVEFLPERLAQFQIYDVGPADSPISSDDITRSYQPTESGTYLNFLDVNGEPLEIDLSDGFVTISGNTVSGFKEVVSPLELAGYATQNQLQNVSTEVDLVLDTVFTTISVSPTKPYTSGYLNIFGNTTNGETWRRTTASIVGNMFEIVAGHQYYYSGTIADVPSETLKPAGVVYFDESGVFIGYDCSAFQLYTNYLLTPPIGAKYFGACSNGSDPIITDKHLVPKKNKDVVYVDASEGPGGDGSVDSPFNTINDAIDAIKDSQFGKIVIYEGDYRETLNLGDLPSGDFELLAREGHRVRVLGSNALSGWTKTLGRTNAYEAAYAGSIPAWTTRANPIFEDGRPSEPIDGSEIHPLQKNLSNRLPFTPIYAVSDVDTVDSTPGTYFHDGSKVYIHTSDSDNPASNGYSYEIITRSANTFNTPATTSKKVNLTLSGLQFYYTSFGVQMRGFSKVVRRFCVSMATPGQGAFCNHSGCIESFYEESAFCNTDGQNNHFNTYTGFAELSDNRSNYATVKYVGLWSHDNGDDGESSHEQHNVHISDSLLEYNGDSGCRPSNDATYIINNTISRKNGWQVGHGESPGKGEGFALVNSALNPARKGCRAVLTGCISEGNNTGFGIANNDESVMVLVECMSRNNTTAEYYAGAGAMTLRNCKSTNSDPSKIKVVGSGTIIVENDLEVS